MQRYFISEKEYMEGIILSDDVFHIVKVMRNKVGDLIEISESLGFNEPEVLSALGEELAALF